MEQILYELKKQVDVIEQMLIEMKEYGIEKSKFETTCNEIDEMRKNIIAAQILYEAEVEV